MHNNFVIKVTTSMPTDEHPGAGLICLRPSLGSQIKTYVLTSDYGKVFETNVDKNILIKHFGFNKKNSFLSIKSLLRLFQIFNNFLLLSKLISDFKKTKPKILICYGLVNFFGCFFYCSTHNIPLVLSLHNVTDFEKIKKYRLLRYLVEKCEEVWTCSYELRNLSKQELKCKIFYRPTGFDSSQFYSLDYKDRFSSRKLISVGSFKWKKNYGLLLSALSILRQKECDLKLCLIGAGVLEKDLRKECQSLGISDLVQFKGILDQDKILEELNSSSIFVLPSLAEGRPKVVAEALATGLPCIVTKQCNCDDIVSGAGIVVNDNSEITFADAIESLLSDFDAWEDMSKKAIRNIKSSEWKEIANLEQKHISKIINRN